ncbi:hypothetical protein OG21DRAFT_1518288 [Imleria badia]|nr:hypothetical protein OG21DRAFT_1518293 [Imleria badia]KAF8546193.1 hypothetical protein OG21DRAFT_1518288 [Imleria badia]
MSSIQRTSRASSKVTSHCPALVAVGFVVVATRRTACAPPSVTEERTTPQLSRNGQTTSRLWNAEGIDWQQPKGPKKC